MSVVRIMKRHLAVLVLAGLVLSADRVSAEDGLVNLPRAGQVSVEPFAGAAFTVGGTFVREFSEVLTQTGTVAGQTFSTSLGFDVENRDFSDVYDAPREVGIQLNYGLSESAEVFGGVTYMRATGKPF